MLVKGAPGGNTYVDSTLLRMDAILTYYNSIIMEEILLHKFRFKVAIIATVGIIMGAS